MESIGAYKGVSIKAGTDAEVKAQIDKINSLQPTQAPTTTAQVTTGTPAIKIPSATPATGNVANANAFTAGSQTYIDTQTKIAEDKATKEKEIRDQIAQSEAGKAESSWLKKLMGASSPSDTRTTALNQTGIDPTQYFANERSSIAEIGKLNESYNATVAQRDAEIARLEENKTGMLESGISGERARIEKNYAVRLNQMSSNINAKTAVLAAQRGMFSEAQSFVNQAVQDATADLKYTYDQYTLMKSENEDLFKKIASPYAAAFNAKVEASKMDYEQGVKDKNAIGELLIKYPSAGINIYSDTLEQAQTKAARYAGTPSGSSISSFDNIETSNLSSLAQSVVANPSLFYNFTPTQRGQIASELQSNGYDISALQNTKLSSGQQDDVAQMNTVSGLIDKVLSYNADGTLEGIGAFGQGTLKSIAAQVGLGSKEGQDVRALIGNIKGTVAKLRGGTSFTPNEEKLLNSYTPSINDSSAVAINKLENLKTFIAQKNADLISATQINTTTGQIQKKGETKKVENLRNKYNY